MKKSFYLQLITALLLPGMLCAQSLHISHKANLIVEGEAKIVLNEMSLINDGNFLAGKSTMLFTGQELKSGLFIGGAGNTSFHGLSVNVPLSAVRLNKNIFVGGMLSMQAGNVELNNHRLDLGSTGFISGESNIARITGTQGGVITASAVLNAPSNANPGNMGIAFGGAANLGLTQITRGHVRQTNAEGKQSIQRYYDVQPTYDAADVAVRLYYLEPELSGIAEQQLVLWSDPGRRGWVSMGKEESDASGNWLLRSKTGSMQRFTLGVAGRAALANAYPNPARDRITVSFYNETVQESMVSLQDKRGKVLERRRVQFIKGMNTLQWNLAPYASGSYTLVFENAGLANVQIIKQ